MRSLFTKIVHPLRSLSIKGKLVAIMFSLTLIAVGSAFTFLVISNLQILGREAREYNENLCHVLAEFLVAPLSFQDKQGAEDMIRKIQSSSSIVEVAVFDKSNERFAYYRNPLANSTTHSHEMPHEFKDTLRHDNHIHSVAPVLLDQQYLGKVMVVMSTDPLTKKIQEFVIFAGITLLAVLVFAFILSLVLQRYISRPLAELASTTKSITAREDFSVRVSYLGNDEIGNLYEAFNSLLGHIQKRDLAREEAERRRRELSIQLEHSHRLETIGTLAGGIAHDFNNLLTPIITCVALTERSLDAEHPARNWLRIIAEASDRAKDLVAQILAFGRQSTEVREPLKVDQVIGGVLKLLRASTPSNVSFKTSLASSDWCVLANTGQIHQIVVNLCTNAAYAMREKGGTIEISVESVNLGDSELPPASSLLPGRYCRLSVKDSGTGMDNKTLDRIFEPFFTTKPTNEGTGLGLSVVHGIVRSLGGHIRVESKIGVGSTFTILLPEVPENTSRDAPQSKVVTPITGRKRILFLDDEEAICQVANEILVSLGYEVITTTSPLKALELFSSDATRYDLVITDQTMPELSGIEFAKKLQSIRPGIPVLLSTGFAGDKVTMSNPAMDGIVGLLHKPYSVKELAAGIEAIFR